MKKTKKNRCLACGNLSVIKWGKQTEHIYTQRAIKRALQKLLEMVFVFQK